MSLNQFNFAELKIREDNQLHIHGESINHAYVMIHQIEHFSTNHNCFEFIEARTGDSFIKCTLVYGNFTYSKRFYLNNYVPNSSHDITLARDPNDIRVLILDDDDDDSKEKSTVEFDQETLESNIRTFFTQAEKMTKSYLGSLVGQTDASRR